MKFTPKTDDELNSMNLIQEGNYNFEVLEAKSQLSKSGNEMIKVKLGLWDNNGVMRVMFDYLLEAMAHKLHHFCDSTGLREKYNSGELNDTDCLSKTGTVHIVIEKGKEKPEGGNYPDRNSVKDYLTKSDSVEVKKDHFINDDVPF